MLAKKPRPASLANSILFLPVISFNLFCATTPIANGLYLIDIAFFKASLIIDGLSLSSLVKAKYLSFSFALSTVFASYSISFGFWAVVLTSLLATLPAT